MTIPHKPQHPIPCPFTLEVMDKYPKDKKLIGTTLFWSPLEKFEDGDKSLRIEKELDKIKHKYGASELFYVHPMHTLKEERLFSSLRNECLGDIQRREPRSGRVVFLVST